MFELGVGYRAQVQFLPPLADSRDFPPPAVRATPGVSRLKPSPAARWSGEVSVRLVDRARTALYVIGRHVGPTRVWMPAYHCPAMVEPFLAAECEVFFYPVSADLKPEFGFLKERLRQGDALVAARYFGFDCGMPAMADMCRQRHVHLIEDLAHAAYANAPLGRFAVTSLVKFLPISIGAELIVTKSGAEADAIGRLYRGLPRPAVVSLRQQFRRIGRRLRMVDGRGADGFRYFDHTRIQRGVPGAIARTIRESDHDDIRSRRQHNFRYLSQHLNDSVLGRPLFAELPGHVVPYVFPFLLRDAETFRSVRRAAIQALRWEELAPTPCEVSAAYRSRLIQLPVHQCLEEQQMRQMIDCLSR